MIATSCGNDDYLLLSPFIYKASELAKVKYQISTFCSENPGKTLKL